MQPLVRFGPEITADLPNTLRREWLVTNGLGGYASASISGVMTRRYHRWLDAALAPPVERTVLVGGSIDWANYDGHRKPLSTHEYDDGMIDPHGYRHLQSFALDRSLPVWTFAMGDVLVERPIWMGLNANSTYVAYHVLRGSKPLDLEIAPLVTWISLAQPRAWLASSSDGAQRRHGNPGLRWRRAVSHPRLATRVIPPFAVGTGTFGMVQKRLATITTTRICLCPAHSPND